MFDAKKKLLILGVHLASEGYPNVRYRLEDLRASGDFDITEVNKSMWLSETRKPNGFIDRIFKLLRAMYAHAFVMWRYLMSASADIIYVPYPAVFILTLLSWLPSRWKPKRVVADVFISLYDTIVNDRKLVKCDSWRAKTLFRIEKKAYDFADSLVVDTRQNAEFLVRLFSMPESKIMSIVLSTNEIDFHAEHYSPRTGTCNVLFVGTLVPLHGIQTILDAILLLAYREDINFTVIGDGQDAPLIEAWLLAHKIKISWIREWQSSAQLVQAIGNSDICLGVFGAGDKTQRVCPFKIYAYAAIGRAIVTGDTLWTQDVSRNCDLPAFSTILVADPAALAAKVIELADNPSERSRLAHASQDFYRNYLCNAIAYERFAACLNNVNASPSKS